MFMKCRQNIFGLCLVVVTISSNQDTTVMSCCVYLYNILKKKKFYSGFVNITTSKPRLLHRRSSGRSANRTLVQQELFLILKP